MNEVDPNNWTTLLVKSRPVLLVGREVHRDGVKVWLNGKLVHRNFVRRQAAPGQDRVSLKLRKGKNLFVIKLEQVSAGGAVLASLHAKEKHTVTANPSELSPKK